MTNNKIFWNRRSGKDRRQQSQTDQDCQRIIDRRYLPNNGYMLVMGAGGIDRFELLGFLPVMGLLSLMALGSYFLAL